MGEYAYYFGRNIKIGTCSSMYYLRLEDRYKLTQDEYSVDVKNTDGLSFRLPFVDEDMIGPGNYKDHDRGLRIEMLYDPCIRKECFGVDFDLVRVKKLNNKLYPEFVCRKCGNIYSWTWDEIWWYLLNNNIDSKMLMRLKEYKNTEFCL